MSSAGKATPALVRLRLGRVCGLPFGREKTGERGNPAYPWTAEISERTGARVEREKEEDERWTGTEGTERWVLTPSPRC